MGVDVYYGGFVGHDAQDVLFVKPESSFPLSASKFKMSRV